MSPIIRIAHAMRHKDNKLAADALAEYDLLRIRIAALERELAAAKRAVLYPMTDIA